MVYSCNVVATADSIVSSISSKSVQVLFHLSAGSELGKLPQVEDLQAVLEFDVARKSYSSG